MNTVTTIYGLLAEFSTPEQLVSATEKVHEAGFKKMDTFCPYPIHGLGEKMGLKKPIISKLVLAAGICGALFGFFMQYYANVISYPLNIAGRPLNSWPSWVPITYELTILCAAGTATLCVVFLNGLPLPYHPCFNVPSFARASRDRFFIVIEAVDQKFDYVETRKFLEGLESDVVYDVPA